MLRIAEKTDIAQITALWGAVFADTRESIEGFFSAFPRCRSYVAEENGQVIAMVHALPRILSPDIPAAYLYAVATAETHRGRGICRELMAFAERDLQKNGFACCILCPAEQGLFDFYKKQGYETAFFRRHTAFSGGRPICLQDYAARREHLLPGPHTVCGPDFLAYAQRLYGLSFYETATGIAAAGERFTAEVLPEDLGGEAFAMVKWLGPARPLSGAYLGFSLA